MGSDCQVFLAIKYWAIGQIDSNRLNMLKIVRCGDLAGDLAGDLRFLVVE